MTLQSESFLRESLMLNLVTRGSGKPVVFQHGLCGSAAQTAEAFPDDDRFCLHTLECRGHGASESGSENLFSIKTFAHDVAAMIEAKELSPCVIGGISMGAAIALHLAVHRPQLVKALILARPAWLLEKSSANNAANREVGKLLSVFPPAVAKGKFLVGETAKRLAQTAPDNLASLSGFFAREPVKTTAALLSSIASDGPGVSEEQVRALRKPTLILATGQDEIHPMSHAEELHAMIPGSKLVTLTPKGVDKPRYLAEFKSALLQFFEEHA